MAITGAHVLLYSSEPEATRAVLRDVFGWKHVDAGHGWLIFALPPAEVAVHPAESPAEHAGMQHQFTLFCDDIKATIRDLRAKGVTIDGEPQDQGWGVTVMMSLPGGVEVMLYQPRHPLAVHS
jgi:predicted enzyme related to lactoylglutathione lyase